MCKYSTEECTSINTYQAGFYKTDITPDPGGVPYLAKLPRHSPFMGVHDRLFVSACAISDGADKLLLISIDGIGLASDLLDDGHNFVERIRDRLFSETGIHKDFIVIHSTHIHSSPDTLNFEPFIESAGAEDWLRRLVDKICECSAAALRSMSGCTLKIGSSNVEGLAHNRRGEPYENRRMTVFLFEPRNASRGRKIVFIHFTCHPTIVQDQPLVSADFIGSLRASVCEAFPATDCLFLQGACGDIGPIVNSTRNMDDAVIMGTALSKYAIECINRMSVSNYPVCRVKIGAVSKKVFLPSRELLSEDEVIQLSEEILLLAEKIKKTREESGSTYDLERELIRLNSIKRRISEGGLPFEAALQWISLGDVCMAAVPGEPFCKMGMDLSDRLKPIDVLVLGYTNEYLGYIAPPCSWALGGYECGPVGPWSKLSEDAYGQIVEELTVLAAKMV